MHVLVIGGTRFVGYLAVWRLLARGHRVTILNRGSLPDPFGDRVGRIRVDRTTPAFGAALRELRFDATVDFASYTRADAEGLLSALGERAGHIVFISTGQVYLVRDGAPRPASERDFDGPLLPRPTRADDLGEWEYGVGKREAELALASSGLPVTRLRIPMVNGERDPYRRIEGYLWRLLDGGPLLLPDGGTAITRHVYGHDVAAAIVQLLEQRQAIGEAYNLAQHETPTIAEVVQHLADRLGSRARLVAIPGEQLERAGLAVRSASPFSTRWMSFVDPTRAEVELGFRHTPLTAYLDAIVGSFLAHPPSAPPEGYGQRDRECGLAG